MAWRYSSEVHGGLGGVWTEVAVSCASSFRTKKLLSIITSRRPEPLQASARPPPLPPPLHPLLKAHFNYSAVVVVGKGGGAFFYSLLFLFSLAPTAPLPPPHKPRLHDKKPIELAAKARSSERDNWRRRLKQQCAQPHWAAPSVQKLDSVCLRARVWVCAGAAHSQRVCVCACVRGRCRGLLKCICSSISKRTPVHLCTPRLAEQWGPRLISIKPQLWDQEFVRGSTLLLCRKQVRHTRGSEGGGEIVIASAENANYQSFCLTGGLKLPRLSGFLFSRGKISGPGRPTPFSPSQRARQRRHRSRKKVRYGLPA